MFKVAKFAYFSFVGLANLALYIVEQKNKIFLQCGKKFLMKLLFYLDWKLKQIVYMVQSVHNVIRLSCLEKACLMMLHFERNFSSHWAKWWEIQWYEKYLLKHSLIKHTCSWCDKLMLLKFYTFYKIIFLYD